MMLSMDSEKIINALGGTSKVARLLGLTPPAVQAWKKRGIPPRIQLDHPRLIAKGKRLAMKAAD